MTAIDDVLQQPIPQAIGWALLQFIWQGAVIAIVTGALLAALRRSAADVRYVVATIALSLMLTIPVVTAMQSLRSTPAASAAAMAPADLSHPAQSSATPPVQEPEESGLAPALFVPPPFGREPLQRWLPVFVSLWLAGVALLTLRLVSSWVWVQRMKSRGAVAAGGAIQRIAAHLSRQLHITRPVRFLESSAVDVPTVIGWLKPVVLLPVSALAGLTPQQLEAILAHELAHIRRHDYLVNLLQAVVETLLFYHPAVWWLSRRIRVERENCCDDLAVRLCGDPVVYAAALAELEGLRAENGHLVLAASGGSLLQRVRRLLGAPSHAGRAPGWLAAAVAVSVIAGICAGAAGNGSLRAQTGASAIQTDDDQLPPHPPEPAAPTELPEAVVPPEPAEPPDPPAHAEIATPAAQATPAVQDANRRETTRPDCHRWARSRTRRSGFSGSGPSQALVDALRDGCEAYVAVEAQVATTARHVGTLAREVTALAGSHASTPAVQQAEPATEAEIAALEARLVAAIAQAPAPTGENAGTTTAAMAEVRRALGATQAAAAAPKATSTTETVQSSTSTRDGQKSGNYVWSNDGRKLEVNYRGDIDFTDDDADVRSITPGGWLRIKDQRRGGTEHRVEFDTDSSGRIRRRFWIGSSERPFDPDGRKWLAEMLPGFIRQSGIGAERRVARIYNARGADGVLAEISLVEGSWAKRVYFTHLLKTPSLGGRIVQQALAQAGREIESDYELASLLVSSDHLVTDEATRRAYFDAARSIGSDYEMRRVFSSALKRGPVPAALLAGMLDASVSIASDYELASLLEQVANQQPIDTARASFFRALDTIDSAYERRRVLTSVFRRSGVTAEVSALALAAAATMKSDYEAATALLQFVRDHSLEGVVRAPFFRAVSTIASPYERGRVLQAAARRSDVSSETVLDIIRATEGMRSGHDKAQVLLTVAGSHQLSRDGRDAYIDASRNLGDHEQGRVLSALVRNQRK